MNNLYINQIFNFNNLNIAYFYLSAIYLIIFSNYIIYNKNLILNLKTKILDILMIVPLFVLTCNNLIDSSYKLILLILIFIFYNYQISYLSFTPSIVISCLYWCLSFYIITIISMIIKPNIKSNDILLLYHSLILIIFIFTVYVLLIPIIKKDIIIEMSYPTNKTEYLLFSFFIINLFIFLLLVFLFNINNISISLELIKTRYILFILNLSYIFYYIYFIISKSINERIEIYLKEILDDDLVLSASAKQEDHIIKKINYYTRLYSCVMKSNTTDPVDNYIYITLKDLLNDFYQEYYTTDEIINEIMSEKNLVCDSLNIVFLLNIIKVDTSKLEGLKLKICHLVLCLTTDIVIIYSNRQAIKEKYIITNIIDFSDNIYLQITANTNKHKNLIDKIIDKNKIMKSNKYKYLNILVKQLGKKIKLNISDEKLNFIIK